MLVLTRRVGESILIGDDVEVKVSEVGGGQVRLSFTAPDDVAIVRKEISRGGGGRMKYRLWDAAGFLIAEVRFHNRTSESVMVEYMRKIATSVGAATYSPVAIVEEEV